MLAVVNSESHILQAPPSLMLQRHCWSHKRQTSGTGLLTYHRRFLMRLIIFRTHVWQCSRWWNLGLRVRTKVLPAALVTPQPWCTWDSGIRCFITCRFRAVSPEPWSHRVSASSAFVVLVCFFKQCPTSYLITVTKKKHFLGLYLIF